MRYVGLTVLGIVFWVDVILLRMVLTHHCAPEELAREVEASREAAPVQAERSHEAHAPVPVVIPMLPTWGGGRPSVIRHGDEVDDPFSNHHVDPLSKIALIGGLNEVRPLVHACYARFGVPGAAMVNIVIARSGRVAEATVAGEFGGTPTGACVEQAVKTARFPPSDGLRTPYPFQLK